MDEVNEAEGWVGYAPLSGEESLLRVYLDPAEIGPDGYPFAWHRPGTQRWIEEVEPIVGRVRVESALRLLGPFRMSIKDYVREQAGNRCLRCGHPYDRGAGEWSPCDELCRHDGPLRSFAPDGIPSTITNDREPNRPLSSLAVALGYHVEAQWRILTVHHLNGVKHDCRWWNLVALCQRCHLSVQSRVVMGRVYPFEHSEWFKPYAAGWYAHVYLGEDLTREETMARLDELLNLERMDR